ncbi:CHC2 zinc finger domain-containing protein [Oleiharenicola lentus]|uniref:CHC2 zinc finger domain-containing protein n=1 Tax=Oleiharenicola lentus TaxID=2508720 RepID=UPI003F67DC79
MNHRPWINFKELRARLKFEDVLAHYNVTLARRGDQHLGPCPLPSHPSEKQGKTFSANLERGIFQCFACRAKGNVLDFAGLMAGADIKDGNALRAVAVELQAKFFPEGASRRHPLAAAEPKAPEPAKLAVNAPLDFHLKELDYAHASLSGLGFEAEVMDHFEAGYCSRGSLKGHVAAALHGSDGKLVGYAKGAATELGLKFAYPEPRERQGVRHEFDLSSLVYNAHRIDSASSGLVIVDSLPSVWWLHQNGRPNAVAVLGEGVSEERAKLLASLVTSSGRVWIAPSGSEAGDALAQSLLVRLSLYRFVHWMKLDYGMQMTDLSKQEIKTCFTV